MSAFLYVPSALAAVYLARRVLPFSRLAALLLLLFPLTLTSGALFTGRVYGPVDLAYASEPLATLGLQTGISHVVNPALSDVYAEFMPWNDALRRSIERGEWPLWNPYELAGTPLAGAAQAAPYHPITVAGLLIPLPDYFTYAAAMLYLIAAIAAFLLAYDLTESETAALLAAAGWMASTHLVFFAGTALANAISVLPLVLLGARRTVREPGRRSFLLLTGALLLLVLSGHPETALHVVALGITYAFFQMAIVRPAALKSVLITGIGAGAAALLLSAVFLLPHLEAITQSEEYLYRDRGHRQKIATFPQLLHAMQVNFFPFTDGSPGLEEARHTPEVRHGWLPTAYAGSLLFAPAIYALARARSREKWFFLGAVIVGIGAGISAPGVTHLLNRLPVFRIAVNDRMVAFAAIGIATLAAIGVAEWMRHPSRRLTWTAGVVGALITIAAFSLPSDVSADYLRLGTARAVLPLLLGAAASALLPAPAAAQTIIILLLLQRAGETGTIQSSVPRAAFYPDFPGLSLMRSAAPFRIVAVGTMLPPATSTHYGLEDVRGFQAVTFARFDATYPLWSIRQPVWSNRVDDLSSPFLSLMNVRFAIAPTDMRLPDGWLVRGRFGAYDILENERVLPRAFVPRNVRGGETAEELRGIADFAEQSLIERGSESGPQVNGPGTVAVQGRGGRLKLRAEMSGAGWIVVTNTAWKGWRATSGERELPIHYANHTFIGIHLPPGRHEIDLIYRPRSFVLGSVISAIAACACGYLTIAYYRRSLVNAR